MPVWDKIKQLGNWFVNTTLKSAINENPAVATASGWTIDSKTGKASQNATEDEGVKQLRKNLAVLGGTGTAVFAAPVVGSTIAANPQIVAHVAVPMLSGAILDQNAKHIGYEGYGDWAYNNLGLSRLMRRSSDGAQNTVKTVLDFTNPGYWIGPGWYKAAVKGITNPVVNFTNNFHINPIVTPKVKYYGPTMGKTTAVKGNPALVDFDDIIREPSKQILKKFGFNNKSEMYNSGNKEAIKMYEDMLLDKMRAFKVNPQNSGKTLVVSPTALANPETIGFHYDNIPSLPSREVFIQRNVGRGGTPEASALWYDSILKRNPNIKIDDRFVSQIEYVSPAVKPLQVELESPVMSGKRSLSVAERLGIPKGERSNPQALEDPYYWGYQQWNSKYNAAVNSGNIEEAQRLRDLHFKSKALGNKLTEGTNPLPLYHFSDAKFTQFDPKKIGVNDPGFYGKGIYTSPQRSYASTYGENEYKLYGYSKRPFETRNDIDRSAASFSFNRIDDGSPMIDLDMTGLRSELQNADAVYHQGVSFARDDKPIWEVVIPEPYKLKLVDPITKTDAGKIIPIVKRDNFHNPDIRYKQGGILKANRNNVLTAQDGNSLQNTFNFVNDMYNVRRVKRKVNRANKYALKHGANNDVTQNDVQNANINTIEDWDKSYTLDNEIYVPDKYGTQLPHFALGHELGHFRRLYNYQTPGDRTALDLGLREYPLDSPYRGNDYSILRKNLYKRLTPNKEWWKSEYTDPHDLEISEGYFDLWGVRTDMAARGIVDGRQRRYRVRDIKRYLQDVDSDERNGKIPGVPYSEYRTIESRYPTMHGGKLRSFRWALNNIYKQGGILKAQGREVFV